MGVLHVQSLTLEEQEAAVTMQALKECKKTSRRHPGTRGSSEGTGIQPGVLDESTVIFATSSEVTGTKPRVSDEEKVTSEENVILEWGSEHESEHSEDYQLMSDEEEKKNNDGDADDEDEDDDHISDIQDTNDEDTVEEKGDAELARNAMTSDYQVKVSTELPLPSSSLSVSSGFGTYFLNLSSDVSLTIVLKDSADAEISSLMDVFIQQETSEIQSPSVIKVPISVILETTILPPIPEFPNETPASTALSPPRVTPIISIMQQTSTPIPTPSIITESPIITTNVPESNALTDVHSAITFASLKSQVLKVIDNYRRSKLESEKSASEIRKLKKEQVEKQKMLKYTIKSTNKVSLNEYDQKIALYQTMHENKSFNRNPANHSLYHALMEALIEDKNAMDKGVADTGKKTKRIRTKESESSMEPSTTKETSKGKALSKSSKTGKSVTTKKPIEEPIAEVVMDDLETNANEYVVNDADRP
ncbi:hypothetical protein Tco_0794854 [Tanacetum coccineum]